MIVNKNVSDYKKSYVHKCGLRKYWKITLEYYSSFEENIKRTHFNIEPFEENLVYHTWVYRIFENEDDSKPMEEFDLVLESGLWPDLRDILTDYLNRKNSWALEFLEHGKEAEKY